MPEAVSVLIDDERSLAYEHDPLLGWFPKKGDRRDFTGSRKIEVAHNARGFRDKELTVKTRPRILFLGDSFVWGYDVNREERFTERLQERMPEFEILNGGISGYGTDQEFLLLQREFKSIQPDLVFLLFSANDRRDNSSPVAYGLAKPFFVPSPMGGLQLGGTPVPKNTVYYFKKRALFLKKSVFLNLILLIFEKGKNGQLADVTEDLVLEAERYLKKRGKNLIVGFVDSDSGLQRFCREQGILFLDLSGIDQRYRFPGHGKHWTPEGHREVSDKIYEYLIGRDSLLSSARMRK